MLNSSCEFVGSFDYSRPIEFGEVRNNVSRVEQSIPAAELARTNQPMPPQPPAITRPQIQHTLSPPNSLPRQSFPQSYNNISLSQITPIARSHSRPSLPVFYQTQPPTVQQSMVVPVGQQACNKQAPPKPKNPLPKPIQQTKSIQNGSQGVGWQRFIRILGHGDFVYCICFDRTGQYIFTVTLSCGPRSIHELLNPLYLGLR